MLTINEYFTAQQVSLKRTSAEIVLRSTGGRNIHRPPTEQELQREADQKHLNKHASFAELARIQGVSVMQVCRNLR